MAYFDMPYDQLQTYTPPREEPADFEAFWKETLAEARAHPLQARFEQVEYGLRLVETFDVTFAGYGGQPIKGWLVLPRQRSGPVPAVVEYIGYGGGRGFGYDWLFWANFGLAHVVMDTRGQGGTWQKGDTPDAEPADANPHYPGFMTRGVLNPRAYYYRRVFTDAVRMVETARAHPAVDASRIAVTGGSQGGGITLAAAGLDPTINAVMPDVPFLCGYRRATQLVDNYPYYEIVRFCQTQRDRIDQVFQTLSYFDGINFAARAKGVALFAVGLMDGICPPSTVYAAYNHYAGPKRIKAYPFNQHEGGGDYHPLEKVKLLQELGWL